jgi:RNA recognition motif-containing protein
VRNELYLGSISTKATEEDIRNLFSLVGTVTSVHLIKDTQTGKFMECGYVKMATTKEAQEAIETLNGALLVNRVLTVSEARQHPGEKKRPFAGSRKPAVRERRPPKGRK